MLLISKEDGPATQALTVIMAYERAVNVVDATQAMAPMPPVGLDRRDHGFNMIWLIHVILIEIQHVIMIEKEAHGSVYSMPIKAVSSGVFGQGHGPYRTDTRYRSHGPVMELWPVNYHPYVG